MSRPAEPSRTVVLHIGIGKTGTSAIQHMLKVSRKQLAEAGIYYPETGASSAHHDLAVVGARALDGAQRDRLRAVLAAFEGEGYQRLVLSSESFVFCTPSYVRSLADVLEGQDVKVLLYVRKQAELVRSAYLQKMKAGRAAYGGDVRCFFEGSRRSFDFMARVEPWVEAFGRASIVARLYDPRREAFDVRTDFCEAAGIPTGSVSRPDRRANPSLPEAFVPLLRRLDRLDLPAEARAALVEELLLLSPDLREGSRRRLITDELREVIEACYAESNAAFAATFLDEPSRRRLLE